jgi:hypothetical protein
MNSLMICFFCLVSMGYLNSKEVMHLPVRQDITRVDVGSSKSKNYWRKNVWTAHISKDVLSSWDGNTLPIQENDYPNHPMKAKQFPLLPKSIPLRDIKRASSEDHKQKNGREKQISSTLVDSED